MVFPRIYYRAEMVRGLPPNYPPPSTGLSNFLHVPPPSLSAVKAIGGVASLPSTSSQ
jgi:hypothetical protein